MENIKGLLKETEELLREQNMADAVRVSGEALARADEAWRIKYNKGEKRGDELKWVLEAGVMHGLTLFLVQQWKECLSTSVMLDYMAAMDNADQKEYAVLLLKLRNLALTALLNLLETYPGSENKDVREHINHIIRYLFNLTHGAYKDVISQESLDVDADVRPAVMQSYETMKWLMDNGLQIEYPAVEVAGSMVQLSRPLPLFSDLLGRMQAVGLIGE